MEFLPYLPGAITTGWMAFRLVSLIRNGAAPASDDADPELSA